MPLSFAHTFMVKKIKKYFQESLAFLGMEQYNKAVADSKWFTEIQMIIVVSPAHQQLNSTATNIVSHSHVRLWSKKVVPIKFEATFLRQLISISQHVKNYSIKEKTENAPS